MKMHALVAGLVVVAVVLAGSAEVQAAAVAHWSMDGNAVNSVVGGPTATVKPGVGFTSAPADTKLGGGAATGFSPNNGIEVLGSSDNTMLKSVFQNNFTVMAWIKPTVDPGTFSSSSVRLAVDFGAIAPSGTGFGINNAGELTYYYNNVFVAGSTFDDTTGGIWAKDQWRHATLTYSASDQTARFYLEGVLKDSLSVSPVTISAATTHGGGGPFSIGVQSKSDSTAGRHWIGFIDDVGVWSHTLTPALISATVDLASEEELKYDISQAGQLFDLHAAGTGLVTLGDLVWQPVTGLSTGLGTLVEMNGAYFLQLAADGSGVRTLHVPEPGSLALLLLGLGVVLPRRRARRS